jgi:hypothetical protein
MRPIRLMSVAFTALLLWSPTVAQCPDCASFTDLETDLNGNPFIAYETGDSIAGCVGSNGAIGIAGSPIFFGPVITHAPDFYHGPDYDPDFRDTVVFNARVTELPATAEALRQEATASGFFYERTNRTYYMRFVGLSVDMWRSSWTIQCGLREGLKAV